VSEIVDTQRNARRISRRGRLIAYGVGIVVCLVIGFHFRYLILWRATTSANQLNPVPALPVIEMPIVEIPKDWIEIFEGGMKFRIHPDLKRLDAPELAGKGLLVFTGDRERKIIVSEPDELLDITSIQGLQKLGDDVRGVSLPRLKIRAYQVSSRDFRWSMSPEEMRKHFDSLRLSRYLRFSSTERLESLLGTELDGLLHVDLESSRKSFDWESKEKSRERFGYIHFVNFEGEEGLNIVRGICRSFRFEGQE